MRDQNVNMQESEPKNAPQEGQIDINKFFAAPQIQGCEEAFWLYYEPANEVYFRLVHNPVRKEDQIPKSLRQVESLTEEQVDLDAETEEVALTMQEQYDKLYDFGLSGFVSEEQLRVFMKMLIKDKTPKQLKSWLRNMGDSIAKYNLLPEAGYIEKNPNDMGHKNLFLFKEVDLEEYRDIAFGLRLLIEND